VKVKSAHPIGSASIMPRSTQRREFVPGENFQPVVAQRDRFCYSDRAAKNLDLAVLWEWAMVARSAAAVI